ncbi:MAG: hypothetical protein J1F42_01755 [Lachnospiraceae bacterium]|nr:hypothetical protein [Lachnospiraceae bacterium]
MCKAVNEFGFNPTHETEQDIYTEAIQTMASCMAMLEHMERSRANKETDLRKQANCKLTDSEERMI